MSKQKNIGPASLLILLLSIVALAYSSYRAKVVGITHDEVTSFINYMPLSIWQIISYNPIFDANNHILNTLLMKLSHAFFGSSELALRLPNLFGHFLYLLFSYRLVKLISSNWVIVVMGFALLNFNPYLLDFFSVARGYGLGIGCIMASLFYFHQYMQNATTRSICLALFWAWLSVYANFIYILYFAILVLVYSVIQLQLLQRKEIVAKQFFKNHIPSLVSGVILMLFILKPLQKLQALQEFRFGGESGFYKDTYLHLLNNSIYYQGYLNENTLEIFSHIVLFFLVSSALLCLFHFYKTNGDFKSNPGTVYCMFLMLLILATVAQHYLLGVAYLTERRAIIFLPFAALLVTYGFHLLQDHVKLAASILAGVLLLFSVNHFIRTGESYMGIREWYYDELTKEVIADMEKDVRKNGIDKATLSVHWTMKNSVEYYRRIWELDWLEPMDYTSSEIVTSGADYYYINGSEKGKVTDEVEIMMNKYGQLLMRNASNEK